jgi:ankyrin repeat protein
VLEHSTSREIEPLQEAVEGSLDHRDDPKSSEDCTRILEAVRGGDFKTLSSLLTNCMTKFDSNESEGPHRTVTSACHKSDSDSFYHCFNLLMNFQQTSMPNKEAYTAIGYNLNEFHKTCFKHMLKHPSANSLHLYYPGDSESTVREIIMETFPDLELPAPLMERLDSTDGDIKLLAALQHDEYNVFGKTLDSNNPNPWYDEPYYSSLLEIACQVKNREQFVRLLLDNGADPNIKNRVTGMPLIHATARSGNFEVLLSLLEILQKKKEINIINLTDNEERTILHWLARLSERKPEDRRNLQDCLNLLLRPDCKWKVGTEDRDRSGNTALYIAVERGFRDRAKLLLSKGADVRVFERGSKILLSDSVSILTEILDDCLLSNKKPLTSKDLKLWLNYQSFRNIVPRIAESELHRDLLKHPVVSTFLILDWEKVRFIFFLDMVFYVMFLSFLTVYILLSEPYNRLSCGGAARNTTSHFTFNDNYITSGINDSNIASQLNSSNLLFLQFFLMISLSLMTLREIAQLIVHRWVYVKSLENWLEILLIISTFISCSGVVESAEVKLHSSAVALLLGWLEMLMLSGRLPLLSVQHEMLRTVSFTFLKYMAGYVTLLIAFALSFYILFKGSSEQGGAEMFANLPISLLKTIAMFTGEFETSDLSFGTLPYTSHVIFLLFVVLVAIVLLNLLNGLAVNDTEEIRRDAERLSLAARAELISRIEGLVNALPKFLKPDIELKKEMFEIYPNRMNKIGPAAVRSLLSIISEGTPNKKEKSTGIQDEWSLFTKKLSALELRQEKLEKKLYSTLDESRQILGQILARLNVLECETTRYEV